MTAIEGKPVPLQASHFTSGNGAATGHPPSSRRRKASDPAQLLGGEKVFMDFAGDTIDIATVTPRSAHAFLAYSLMMSFPRFSPA
jgi:hypothetical protein